MTVAIQHPTYGQILYSESFWTGRKALSVNGMQLPKKGKNIFYLSNNDQMISFQIDGNIYKGQKLQILNQNNYEVYDLVPASKTYEIALSILIFIFILVWGSSVELCKIFPVVGGAIGGAISGAMSLAALTLMKKSQKLLQKIGIWAAIFVATVLLCYLVAILLLSLA